MITAAQEQNVSNARRALQDKKVPHVININDGRLMPNVPRLRTHKDYRVYTGPRDPDGKPASLPQRMKWLAGAMHNNLPRIVDSSAQEPFDIGKASRDELIVFASSELGMMLPDGLDAPEMRKRIMAYAQTMGNGQSAPEEDMT